LEERDRVFDLIRLADLVLQPFHCQTSVRKFNPPDLPVFYAAGKNAAFSRAAKDVSSQTDPLWSGVIENILHSDRVDTKAELCLNFHHPLIRKLARLDDRQLTKTCIEMLYGQALLMARVPLQANERDLLSRGTLALIERGTATH